MKLRSNLTALLSRAVVMLFVLCFLPAPCKAGQAEIDSLMKFAGNIHQFNSIFPQEKVFLQFDNTSYYTGETIWFKAFVVNASSLKRSESRVLYVDLLSPDGVLLKQQKLMIVAGQADGALTLIDASTAQARDLRGMVNYPSGFYEVRAYTNYMLNFNQEAIFSRVFAVYDKPKKEGNFYEENPTITVMQKNIHPVRPETPKQRNINAMFFPEGGNLVIGQPCRVAFKVTQENGLGMEAKGSLSGTDITFSTEHDGMGSFVFTPQARRNSVRFTSGNDSRTFQLPDAVQSGCTLMAEMTDQDSIVFDICSTPDFVGREMGMTLTCRGDVVGFATLTLDGRTRQGFSLAQLPEGVIRLTMFTPQGNIVAARSFYHSNANVAVPELKISADKGSYGPFEKVALTFSLSDGKGAAFRDRFSLAVRDSRSQANVFTDDLRINFLLSSDLKGYIEKPAYYFNPENENRLRDLDLLCMVQGWERYGWSSMSGNEEFRETYRQETGLSLNGWVLDPKGNKPLSKVEVSATLVPVDKSLTEQFSYITDNSGYFGFDIGVAFYDKARLSIKATPKKNTLIGTPARIMLERSKTPAVREYLPGEDVFVGNSALKPKVRQSAEPVDDGLPTVINIETGYILPDVEIDEHRRYVDYYKFQAYDVLKDVELELDKGEYSIDVYGYLLEKGYDLAVVPDDTGSNKESLIINGYPAYVYAHTQTKYKDLEFESGETSMSASAYAASFDTRDIKSIMVYDRPMYMEEAWEHAPLYSEYLDKTIDMDRIAAMNDRGSSGSGAYKVVYMVDILLKEEHELSTRKEIMNLNQRLTTVDGYSRPYSFYAPEYPTGPIPGDVDYRRTLYWNPNVITDENGNATVEFYNSSITKHFNVEAAGITASGVPYTLDAGF